MTRLLEVVAEKPEEMRAALFRARYSHDMTSAILHRAMDVADIQGLSGEDRYTLLAWHMTREVERLQKHVLSYVNCSLSPQVFEVKL